MRNEKKQRNSHYVKNYLLAFFTGFLLISGIVLLAVLVVPKNLPHYMSLILYFLIISPLFIIFGYLLYRALAPITGGMPLKTLRQWALLYPFLVGLGGFWAFLSFIFETYAPALPQEERTTTLPILVIAIIVIFLSTTRLRYSVARFINKIFGTKPQRKSSDNE